MKLEKIKRTFIKYMEEIHGAYPYPRNFYGCLISIIVEPEPVSQERIMELTWYSQATVSLTLQKIQLLMSLRTVRKVGDRKHYYTYDGPPEEFLLDTLRRRLDVQDIDVRLIEMMLEKVSEKSDDYLFFRRFLDYLKNMRLYLTLIHSLRKTGLEPFKHVLDTGSFDDLDLQPATVLEKGMIADFLENLKTIPFVSETIHSLEEDVLNEYLLLKNEYFTGIKTNINPLFSQAIANQLIILHYLLLEGCATQDMIEKSTLLPRSTISEILAGFVKRRLIKFVKKPDSRTKLYKPAISFTEHMLGNFDRVTNFASAAVSRLSEFVSMTRRIRPKSKETKKFLELLKSFEKAYSFTHKFSQNMKVEFVMKLKEEYERGFVFI